MSDTLLAKQAEISNYKSHISKDKDSSTLIWLLRRENARLKRELRIAKEKQKKENICGFCKRSFTNGTTK